MAVRANSARLRTRLENYQRFLHEAAVQGAAASGLATVDLVQGATESQWSGDTSQIGFDINSFSRSIQGVEHIPDGVGILNVQKMGTAEDFEKIGKGSGLWHEGTKRGDAFRQFILERPGNSDSLAELRKVVWGDTNPQWWFLEYGNGYAGAFPVRAGTLAITTALYDAGQGGYAGSLFGRTMSDTVNEVLRRHGVF